MKRIFSSLLNLHGAAAFFAVIVSVFAVVATVQAATTISTNIQTDGMLSVTGTSTLMGNIGINTNSPATQVDIEGTGSVPFSSSAPEGSGPSVVTINDTAAVNPLEIHSANAQGMDLFTHANQAFRGPVMDFYKSRGSQASPTAVQSGDNLAYLTFGGYDGSAYAAGVQLQPFAAENWTTGAHGARLTFWTNTIGTLTLAQRMALDSNGLGIGVSVPTAPLEVATLSSNATTTVVIGKSGQNKGSCLVMYDAAGTVQYISIQGGALVVSSTSCR